MLVPNKVRKSVVFLCIKEAERFKPKATAFMVSAVTGDRRFYHLVTAAHCIAKLYENGHDVVYARHNKVGGGMREFPIRFEDWHFHSSRDSAIDVVAVPYSPERHDVVYTAVPIEHAITDEIIKLRSIGVGEEVFITGLFRNHHGQETNVPIVRVGTIAAMPEEKVWTRMGYMDAYLVEAMSIGGLSGSPVFVHLSPLRTIQGVVTPTTGQQYYLLGLMHGHFDVRNLNDDIVRDDDALESINTGIGIVVPASKIRDIIMSPELVRQRETIVENLKKESEASPDLDSDDEARESPDTAGDPQHAEDSKSLEESGSD